MKLRDNPETLHELTGLGRMWLTYAEVAKYYKCTERSVYKFFNRCPAAREAFYRGQALGRLELRKRVMRSNHPAVMIFAAKAILGWSDAVERVHVDTNRRPVDLTTKQLVAIASRPR